MIYFLLLTVQGVCMYVCIYMRVGCVIIYIYVCMYMCVCDEVLYIYIYIIFPQEDNIVLDI